MAAAETDLVRITELDALVLCTPGRDLTYVRLRTDEGLVGLSEASLAGRTETLLAYLREITPRYVVGSDPFETERLIQRIVQENRGRVGEVVATGVALVEIACWDLIGKALGVPVYRLLGGAVRDRIKACASGWSNVGRTAEEFAAAARRALTKGYRALKFNPFGNAPNDPSRAELHQALRLSEAVRAAVGPEVELVIDLGGRFTPAAAVRIARALDRVEPSWIQDPVSAQNVRGLARVAQKIPIPVASGANCYHRGEFRHLFEPHGCDIVQPDLTHCCGIGEARKIAAMAETYGITVAPQHTAGCVATSANLHLAATLANFQILECVNDFDAEEVLQAGDHAGQLGQPVKEATGGCPDVVDGYFLLPEGPGLGVRVNEDVIRAHASMSSGSHSFEANWHRQQAIHA